MKATANPKVAVESQDASVDAIVRFATPPMRVFIPLITPFLYGMERAVIEIFDSLRPEVEPHFLQSNRIYQRRPPIIDEMESRGFYIELLPDKTDWERLAKPKSFKHLCQMIMASVRSNLRIFKGVRGKDALYVASISSGSSSLLAAIYCRLTGRRVIHHFHDLGTNNRLFPLWIPLVTDFVHNTEFGYEDIARKLPSIQRKRNVVLHYIVKIRSEAREDGEITRALDGKRNVFFVGQVSRHKGVDLLVRAFTSVACEHRDVTLHLVGGFKEDFRSELDELIAAAGLAHRVRFWGYKKDVLGLLRSAYVYVQSSPPSRFHDCSPLSVIEAMALGIPTICFRSGALPEMVIHEKTGLVCEESVASLVDAMNRLLLDTEFRHACAAAAKQRYEELWCPHRIRESWLRFLEKEE